MALVLNTTDTGPKKGGELCAGGSDVVSKKALV